jgi:hypothetical protein
MRLREFEAVPHPAQFKSIPSSPRLAPSSATAPTLRDSFHLVEEKVLVQINDEEEVVDVGIDLKLLVKLDQVLRP